MRRNDKEVTDRGIIEALLASATVCRLAMVDHGEPYIVPLHYGFRDNALYAHSATAGRKLDILQRNGRVCFEIESDSAVVPHADPCRWSTRARSIVGYGRVEILTDSDEKRRGLEIILARHGWAGSSRFDEGRLQAVVVLRIAIESLACKQLGDWG